MIFGFVPIPLYTFFPDNSRDTRKSYTCVNNKIVHRFGILEKTNVYKEGALTTTNNLVFDGYTGTPVLTTVNNEFNDTIYNYTIPAHLIYDGMGTSYKTNNFVFTGTAVDYDTLKETVILSVPQLSDLKNFIQSGDELLLKDSYTDPYNNDAPVEDESYTRCFVMEVNNESKTISIQSPDGYAPSVVGNATMYIYRPVNRNQLKGTVGTIVSKHNPLTTSTKTECK
jgi:hypothetical protein